MKTTSWRLPSFVLALLIPLGLTGCPDDAPRADDTSDSADLSQSDATETPEDIAAPDVTDTVASSPEEGLAAALAALCPAYAARYCAETERCGCTAAPGFPVDCAASFESACAAQLTSYLPFAASGEAVYRPENAAQCLDALTPVYAACVPLPRDNFFMLCPILTPPGGFTGLPVEGEACEGSCALPLRCATDGTCKKPGVANAPCQSPYDCDPALVCVDETCQAPRQADVGNACTGPEECSGDTTCIASILKTCRPPATEGTCRYDEDCAMGHFCAIDTEAGDTDGLCTPAGAAGETCGNGVVCAVGLACDMWGGVCGALPGSGETCAQGPMGPVVCEAGLSCLDGTCGAPPGDGMACAMGAPNCAAGLGCAFETEGSFCRPRRAPGGECQNDQTCADGGFCNFSENRCEAIRAVGDLCTDGNECGTDGACLPDADFTFRCAPRPGDGGTCLLDDCQAGLICRTPYTAGVCAPALCEALKF